jgi:hypothetical protein
MILSQHRITSKKLEESLPRNNQFLLVTQLISQNASRLKLLLTRSSKLTWTSMIRTISSPTLVLIMILSLLRTTSRKLEESSPKSNPSQLATQLISQNVLRLRLLPTKSFKQTWTSTTRTISSPTLELTMTSSPLRTTSRKPEESLLKNNQSQLATVPTSQNA